MAQAIIIGGGIAGPVVGIALRRAGMAATVYEAHPERGGLEVGGWLTVAVNGLSALRALGIGDPVAARGLPTRTIEFVSGTGKSLGSVPLGGALADGTVTHSFKRAALVAELYEQALACGVRFETGKRLVAAEPTPDGGALARFEDGSEARGEVLIGADGVRSRVRQILDPAAPAPRYTGLGNFGGFAPPGTVELEPGRCMMMFGKRCFFGAVADTSGEIWWFANPPRASAFDRGELAGTTSEQWKRRLAAMFADDRPPAAQIVLATVGPVFASNQYDLPSVPVWQRGPMVIVGDAAHAANPSSGQGASMAIEDALTLARCLRDSTGVAPALASYVQMRRERVERVVAHGASMNSSKQVGPVGRVLRDLVMPAILRRLARQQGEGSLAWLFDHRIEWAPDSARKNAAVA